MELNELKFRYDKLLKDEEFDNYIREKHTREMMEDLGLKILEDLDAFFDNG